MLIYTRRFAFVAAPDHGKDIQLKPEHIQVRIVVN